MYDHTLEELKQLDFGSKFSKEYAGLQILTFEDILQKLACHVIMNIHIKTIRNEDEYDEAILGKIIALIKKYDCEKYVYFCTGNDNLLRLARQMAPQIACCVGAGNAPWALVERALEFDCKKIQLFKPHFDQAMIDKAHANGIRCNVFWSDDPKEAEQFIKMGVDTILTNDYNNIARTVKKLR